MRSQCLRKLFGLYVLCFVFHHTVVIAKVFERCELAQLLKNRYRIGLEEVANWVCIAQYQSGLNSSLYTGTTDNGAHGLFQISDMFWCTQPGRGYDRGIACDKLRDDDLTDDITCVQRIHEEHQRLSGDGFNAWSAYPRFCKDKAKKVIQGCFDGNQNTVIDEFETSFKSISNAADQRKSKVYDRCELAQELRHKHNIPIDQIATWVCIAKYESKYNTSAIGRGNADGSGDHGLFQISDIYWCSPPGNGWACRLSCDKLEDSDITDDVECMKLIYEEHKRLSGDGFNAWAVYNSYCQGRSDSYIQGCFTDFDDNTIVPAQFGDSNFLKSKQANSAISVQRKTGKVYSPCELAIELRDKHNIPHEQIATWVCIAKYESKFNTSAIGRLNTDDSGDHGLFQISDIYWCSPPGNGWVCGLSCNQLEDSDITDDVECMKKIYEEHQRMSGDGFNAWSVYRPYCQGRAESYIEGCLNDIDDNLIIETPQTSHPGIQRISNEMTVNRGKVYNSCELAYELRDKHNIPVSQIAMWVCIAKHESNYNTSAVSHLNTDGSEDHGLFQISDIYWCSPPGKGWACGLSCSQLEDSDITDDVECMKRIHEEHQRLSGDGFNAWAVYNPYCKGRADSYIEGCFSDDIDDNAIVPTRHFIESKSIRKGPGKIYTRCELADELRNKHKMPPEQIGTWVCIAEHESHLNTSALNYGSGDHGLFQISNIYWCSTSGVGKACEISCSKFEDDDITDDVRCIKKIYDEHRRLSGDGFNAWAVYSFYCKGKSDKYIKDCSQAPAGRPTTTTRPHIILPAITAPNDIFAYSEKFTTFSSVTKSPTFAFKFSGTTHRPASGAPVTKKSTITSNSLHFDDKFFPTALPYRPGIQQPTISPFKFKYSSILPSTFRPTVASSFNVSPTSRTDRSYFSTTLKPLSSTTLSRTSFNIFDLYTRPGPSITPRTQFTTPTVAATSRPTTSRPNRFIGFSSFGSSNLSSTTLKTYRFSDSARFSTTQKTPTFSFGFTTSKPRTKQPNRGSSRFVSTIQPYNRFSTLYQTRPTRSQQNAISSQAPRMPAPTKNIFDIYFDLYNLQRSAASIPTSSRIQSSTSIFHQQTTKQPFWLQNSKFSTTRFPSVYDQSSTPEYRGVRFGSASTKNPGNLAIITTRKFADSTIFTTKKPFKFQETVSHRPTASPISLFDYAKLSTSTQPWAYHHSSTISETTPVYRGFRFGSAFTNNPEKSEIITKPLKLDGLTLFTNRKPLNRTFNNQQAETMNHYRFESLPSKYFDDVKISTTKAPLVYYHSSTNSQTTSKFRGFRFGTLYTSHPENLATTTTKVPLKFEKSQIFTTKEPFKFEDSTISTVNKPFRFLTKTLHNDAITHRPGSSTKLIFDEFFDRLVH